MANREQQIADAVEHIRRLNSQLETFYAGEQIAFDDTLLPSAAIKQIRALYDAFHQTFNGQ